MGLDLITYLKYENHPYLNYSYTDIITKQQSLLELFHWQFINSGWKWMILQHWMIISIPRAVVRECLEDLIIYPSAEVCSQGILRVGQHFSPKAKMRRIRREISKAMPREKIFEYIWMELCAHSSFSFFFPSFSSSPPGVPHSFCPLCLTFQCQSSQTEISDWWALRSPKACLPWTLRKDKIQSHAQ